MSSDRTRALGDQPAGFHEGERTVQERSGVTLEAARLTGMLGQPDLDGGAHAFLADQEFAVLSARDASGLLWASPLIARKGFLDGHGQQLDVAALPVPTDPLCPLPAAQSVGLVAIDFARRRRLRVNGRIVASNETGFSVAADQAYGNCPQYIHRRPGPSAAQSVTASDVITERGSELTERQRILIAQADTFFLATAHPTRGNDASHRGGPSGFVQSGPRELWWPDCPGNNMFNSLGNLAVDPAAGLLFLDFASGETLQLSGSATVEFGAAGASEDEHRAGRRVRFTVAHVVHTRGAFEVRSAVIAGPAAQDV